LPLRIGSNAFAIILSYQIFNVTACHASLIDIENHYQLKMRLSNRDSINQSVIDLQDGTDAP